MKKLVKWCLLCMIIFIIFFHFVSPLGKEELANATSDSQLSFKISKLLSHPDLKGASIGISVRSASNGQVIYMHNGDARLRPASSLKLVTSAAALQILGENYRFSTEIYTDGKQKGNVLKGNLYIRGKGDPTLLEKDLKDIAVTLEKLGIKKIKGDLIADDTWYDHTRLSMDMPWSDEQEYYGAQISGLTTSPDEDYDAGTVIVEVKPGKRTDKAATVTLIPQTDYVKIINKTNVGKDDSKNTLKIVRKHGNNQIILTGTIPFHSEATKHWISVWDPTGYTLDLLKKSIEKQGIKMTGESKYGKIPAQHTKLITDYSPKLGTLLVPYMKLSNNTISEVLVKEIGRVKGGEGSWDKGLSVIEGQFDELGIERDAIHMRDGSGLSQVNMISANALTQLLYKVQFKSWYSSYINALPVAGISNRNVGGTLRNRMKGTQAQGKVLAKTGTISMASSLSGYVQGEYGNKYVFSIIINNAKEDHQLKKIEDELAVILAGN